MKFLTVNPSPSTIETAPLRGVLIGLTLTAIPLIPKVAGWIFPLFLLCALARYLMNRPGARLPSLPMKLILFVAGIGGVALTYGSMLGIEPGLSTLVVLVCLKMIETGGERDFHVLVLLGYFLALCGLFFSQDLLGWLYVALVTGLLTATLIRFHRGSGTGSYRKSTQLAFVLFAQTIPLVVLMFLFFPRVYGGFRFQFGQSLLATGGMSDRLSPGSISSLALSDDTAFRADFPDGNIPSMSSMYWRGSVLWNGDGLNWTAGQRVSMERRQGQLGGAAIRQRISLVPHGGRWLFALDRPASDVRGASYQPGGWLQSYKAITNRLLYEVVSRPDNREVVLPADQRLAATRAPVVSDRVKELAAGWKTAYPEPREFVENALNHFRREHFSYTLEPGTYDEKTGLDTFLFERRAGFCEHYAATFATLMRLGGIPSRVVIGYHGGEFNTMGNYVIVRQSDAHAWCEVWLKDAGWRRVDPTDMIAPERISAGLASFLESRATQSDPDAAQRSLTAAGWRELQRELQRDLRLMWDGINYQWDLRVLNFDEETQRSFLFSLGLGAASWPEIAVGMMMALAMLVAILTLWLRRRQRPPDDPVSRAYARFCRILERGGLRRDSWEGPAHYGERAAAHFAAQGDQIREITSLYIQLRYSAQPPKPDALAQAVRRLPRLASASTNGT